MANTIDTTLASYYPFSLRILNEKHEEKIYLEDKSTTAILEIKNESSNNIYFNSLDLSKLAGPDNYHFSLKFRPGILKSDLANLVKNKALTKGWVYSMGLVSLDNGSINKMPVLQVPEIFTIPEYATESDIQPLRDTYAASFEKNLDDYLHAIQEALNDNLVVMYFLNTNSSCILKNEKIRLPLKHLEFLCEQGTQVTQVELQCNNLTINKEQTEALKSHTRHYNLSIINHRGSPYMPIHIGFTGFNTILNDGVSTNTLNLRISNLQRRTHEQSGIFTFSHRKKSKMFLYFVSDKISSDYALGTADQVQSVALNITLPKQANDTILIHEPMFQGNTPIWEIYPQDDDVILQPHLTKLDLNYKNNLPDDSCLDISISGILSNFKMGVTQLYLRFENIPGFWDQCFHIPIIKQPMVFKEVDGIERIGIGTVNPQAKLNISELVGTQHSPNTATLLLDHENSGGASSIVFRSKYNRGSDYAFIQYQDADTVGAVNEKALLTIGIKNDADDHIALMPSGNVGIGTTTPTRGRLEVISWTGYIFAVKGGVGTMADGSFGTWGKGAPGLYGSSIFAEGKILAHSFLVPSDIRTKDIKSISNNEEDLSTLLKIEITDYQMKDIISKGSKTFKKVIAQQIEQVYPTAISKSVDVVPDIYQRSEIKDGWISLTNSQLQVGEKIQLIFESGKEIVVVLEVNEHAIKVNSTKEEAVFIYGREIEDFLSVDYEAISMLNVSATQELAKEINNLKNENDILKTALAEMKKDIAELKLILSVN